MKLQEQRQLLKDLIEVKSPDFTFQAHSIGTHTIPYRDLRGLQRSSTQVNYKVTIGYQGRTMTTAFHTGVRTEVTLYDVLVCMLSESEVLDYRDDFLGWVHSMGYNGLHKETLGQDTHMLWEACWREATELQALLGEEFTTFLTARREEG